MPPFFWLFVVACVVLLLAVFAFVLKASLDSDTIAQLEIENRRLRGVSAYSRVWSKNPWVPDDEAEPTRIEFRTRTADGVRWIVGDLEDLAGRRFKPGEIVATTGECDIFVGEVRRDDGDGYGIWREYRNRRRDEHWVPDRMVRAATAEEARKWVAAISRTLASDDRRRGDA